MLRNLALLLVKRLKKNTFLVNVPLKWLPPEAFFSPKCRKYRLAAGLRPDPLGELTALPRPLAGFKGRTSKGSWEGRGPIYLVLHIYAHWLSLIHI